MSREPALRDRLIVAAIALGASAGAGALLCAVKWTGAFGFWGLPYWVLALCPFVYGVWEIADAVRGKT